MLSLRHGGIVRPFPEEIFRLPVNRSRAGGTGLRANTARGR
jgi:hypothetical protein